MKLKLHRDSPKSTSTSVKKSWISINHVKMKKGGKLQSTICNKFWIFNKALVFYLSVGFWFVWHFCWWKKLTWSVALSYNWFVFWAVLSWCKLLLTNVRYIVSSLRMKADVSRVSPVSCSLLPAVVQRLWFCGHRPICPALSFTGVGGSQLQ